MPRARISARASSSCGRHRCSSPGRPLLGARRGAEPRQSPRQAGAHAAGRRARTPTTRSATAGGPEIWSIGHRNVQGAALQPGRPASCGPSSTAPRGGDEINVPQAGKNYGWPVITYGRDYSGAKIGEGTEKAGMEQPIYYWDPSIAPSGVAFYTGDLLPGWKGNLFVGALAGQALHRLVLDGEKVVGEEVLLEDLRRAHPRRAPGTRRRHLAADRRSAGPRAAGGAGFLIATPPAPPGVPRSPGPRGCRFSSACALELRSLAFSSRPITQSPFLSSSRKRRIGLVDDLGRSHFAVAVAVEVRRSWLRRTGDPRAPWPRTPGATGRHPCWHRRRQTARPRTVSTPHR